MAEQLEMFPGEQLRGQPENPGATLCQVWGPSHELYSCGSAGNVVVCCRSCRRRWYQLDGHFWPSAQRGMSNG